MTLYNSTEVLPTAFKHTAPVIEGFISEITHFSFVIRPAEQTWGDPDRCRPQALQWRLLQPFPYSKQLVHGRLCELRLLLPQQAAHAEDGPQQQNSVQRRVSGQVQRGMKMKRKK